GSASFVELQRLLHTLKGGARMAGITTMGNLSHALETLLAGMAERRVVPTAETLDLLQQCLDTLHTMRDCVEGGRPLPASGDLVARIDALSSSGAKAAESSAQPTAAGTVAEAAVPEGADAPPDLGTTARQLRPVPGEDVTRGEPREDAAAATDRIEQDVGGEPSSALRDGAEVGSDDEAAGPSDTDVPAADKGFRRTVPGLDALARRLSRFKRAPQKPAEPEAPAAAEATDEAGAGPDKVVLEGAPAAEARGAAPTADAEGAAPAADGHSVAPAEPAEAAAPPSRDVPPRAVQPDGRAAERAETARVDAALLDALLNSAGEINIFQSRLNQQLHSIDFHLGELGQTVTRLREQLRKLEAETEAQILYRHQDDVSAGGQGFDPLELDRYSTIQQLSRALAETANDVASINELLQGLANEAETLLSQQARVTSELQEGLMQTRMLPFQRHSSRLARIVRQAASDTSKLAEPVVHGGGSEVDRQVLDTMLAPFEHLLRNAVVHGIEPPAERRKAGKPETGRIELSLRREGSEVLIE